jgi:hypothetical protein
MGILEEIVKNKGEIIVSLLSIMEGKETTSKVNLDGVELQLGKTKIKLAGQITFTVVPPKNK